MASRSLVSEVLHVASAAIALLFIFVCFLIHNNRKNHAKSTLLTKNPVRTSVVALVSLAYVAQAAFALRRGFAAVQDEVFSTAFFALAWGSTLPRTGFFVVEIFGLALISLSFGIPLLVLDSWLIHYDSGHMALFVVECVRLFAVLGLLVESFTRLVSGRVKASEEEEEASPLLNGATLSTALPESTGASPNHGDSDSDPDEDEEDDGPEDSRIGQIRRSGSWVDYLQAFKIFLPFLIPKRDLKVQACLVISIVCIFVDRFLNIIVPTVLGLVADRLFAGTLPYGELALYFALDLVHGSSGLGWIQTLVKIPIEQFSRRQLSNAAFNHVMSLAMDFHSDRDSAEVMKAIGQGSSLTRILEVAVLEMAPTIFDMAAAFVLLYVKFDSSVALSMMAASFAFIIAEVTASNWNIENRRVLTKTEREEARVMHQAVQGWQTVSAFNMFSYEKYRFGAAVDKSLIAKKKWLKRDALINAVTMALVPMTFFLIAALVVRQVHLGNATPGDFVFLIQYWDNLIWPIKVLSHEYRYIMSDLIDAERLLDLLTTEPSVKDKPDALELSKPEGRVDFEGVGFSYDDKRTTIKGVDISAAAGETIALVGTTGAGKSTLMKLLMRYYDVTSGAIKIDGHDIRDITQSSLRDAIGVVPQDPLLFNTTIMENLRYARIDATEEEIHEACRAAAIHDKICTFTAGYDTKVGEQGVKLSGGEVQRLAIARVFLKDPRVLILDEATSAVDTETEWEIQAALKRLSSQRTTFVIAHRLSTVVRADQILVVEDGTVIERGTHEELVKNESKYYSLWQKQLGAEEPLLELE